MFFLIAVLPLWAIAAPKPELQGMPVPDADTIKLLTPRPSSGKNIMEAFWARRAAADKEVRSRPIELRELSELMWVAYGVNRDNGQLTVPTQGNAQNGDVYALLPQGAYRYDHAQHSLVRVSNKDLREHVAAHQTNAAGAPLQLVIVMHPETLKGGDDETRKRVCHAQGGIISQNISLYCAGMGLLNRPRATMNRDVLRQELKLDAQAYLVMNHLVAYQE